MAVPLPVIAHGGLLGRRLGVLQGDAQRPILPPGGGGQQLQGVHGLADVPAAGGGDMLPHPLLQNQAPAQPLLQDVHPRVHGGEGVLRGDLLELKHGGPGQHRPRTHRKTGFSVVEAMRVIFPFSINSSRDCCCFLLKYWISSR